MRPQIRVALIENGPVAAKQAIRSSRPAQNVGREFQICKLGPKSTIEGTQTAKVVYPPPPTDGNSTIEKWGGKMEPRRPLIQPLRGSTLPKLGHFDPKIGPKQGHSGAKRGVRGQRHPPKSPFFAFFGPRGVGVRKRPKTPQTSIFSGSTKKWA